MIRLQIILIAIILALLTLSRYGASASLPIPSSGATPVPSPTSVPNVIVNTTLDMLADDGYCTLREAVHTAASGDPSGSSPNECTLSPTGNRIIEVPAGHYQLTLTSGIEDWQWGDLDFGHPIDRITVRGAGVTQTMIDGMAQDRVMDLTGTVALEDILITNGQAPEGANGGGIRHTAIGGYMLSNSLMLSRVAVRNNHAGAGTAITQAGNGGGIALEAHPKYPDTTYFWMVYSEASNNDAGIAQDAPDAAVPGNGGGVWFGGYAVATIQWSTISSNYVDDGGAGGGVYNNTSTYLTMLGVTIAENQIGDGTSGNGGGLYTVNHATIRGTILANNLALAGPDCAGEVRSDGGNLVADSSGCGFVPLLYDQVGVDPHLGALQNNGGPGTYTHALLEASPAIDQGLCTGDTQDQRGLPRPVDIPQYPNGAHTCDVGAFERQLMPGDPTVTPTASATGTPNNREQIYLPLIQR